MCCLLPETGLSQMIAVVSPLPASTCRSMQLYDVLISPSGNHVQLACDEPSLSFLVDSRKADVGVVDQVNCCAWWAQNWEGSLRDAACTSEVMFREDMVCGRWDWSRDCYVEGIGKLLLTYRQNTIAAPCDRRAELRRSWSCRLNGQVA
jgi:hypothetical protein